MFRSLRVRNYRLYASGQLVSLTGTWMQRVAQDWLVLALTNSGTALGIVTALQFGPALLLGLWGGVLADRGDKRKLLLATQTGLALVALMLGCSTSPASVQYWHVLVLAAAARLYRAVDTPVRQSFVVEMVGKDDLANAVGINSTIFNTGRILGPAVAGVMITAVGTGWAFVANAFQSLAVLAGLAVMRPAELYPARRSRAPRASCARACATCGGRIGPDAHHGAGLRGRHVRAELPDHHRADGQAGVRPRRERLRAAVHRAGRRRVSAARSSPPGAVKRPIAAVPVGRGARVQRARDRRRRRCRPSP